MAELVEPRQEILPSSWGTVCAGAGKVEDAARKLLAMGKSALVLDANVTRPTLSLPLENLFTKLVAACITAPQEPLTWSEFERSTTITMLTSRRVTVALAFTFVEVNFSQRMNRVGTLACAVTLTVL